MAPGVVDTPQRSSSGSTGRSSVPSSSRGRSLQPPPDGQRDARLPAQHHGDRGGQCPSGQDRSAAGGVGPDNVRRADPGPPGEGRGLARAPPRGCRGDRRSSAPVATARRRGEHRSRAAGTRPWTRRGRSRSTRCRRSRGRRASRSACITSRRAESGRSGRWTIREALPAVSPWRIWKSRLTGRVCGQP